MKPNYPFHSLFVKPAFTGSSYSLYGHANFYGMDPYDTHGKRAMRDRIYRRHLNGMVVGPTAQAHVLNVLLGALK